MTGDQLARLTRVEVAEHLRDAAKHAGRYIDDYTDDLCHNRRGRRAPVGLHPKVAELCREIALDNLAVERVAA